MAGATINSLERSDVSWNEKHQPNSIGELAVSSPKVKQIKEWILNALNECNHLATPDVPTRGSIQTPLLLLTGIAGCGKSTAVEVICKELGVKTQTFAGIESQDIMVTSSFNPLGHVRNSLLSLSLHEKFGHDRERARLQQQRQFSANNGLSGGLPAAVTAHYMPGNNKSIEFLLSTEQDSVEQRIHDFEDLAVRSRYPSLVSSSLHSSSRVNNSNRSEPTARPVVPLSHVVDLVDDDNSDDDFQHKTSLPLSNRHLTNSKPLSSSSGQQQSILLLHDTPAVLAETLGISSDRVIFEKLFPQPASQMARPRPVVIVLSDVGAYEDDLALPQHIRARVALTTIACQPVTATSMKKSLERILDAELGAITKSKSRAKSTSKARSGGKGLPHSSSSSSSVTMTAEQRAVLIDDLIAISIGDIRHAVWQLQLRVLSKQAYTQSPAASVSHYLEITTAIASSNNTRNSDQRKQVVSKHSSGITGAGSEDIADFSDDSNDLQIPLSKRRRVAEAPLQALVPTPAPPSEPSRQSDSSALSARMMGRDETRSSLYVIGKLLHAKLDKHGKSAFDVEDIIQSCDFPVDVVTSFLQYHSCDSIHSMNATFHDLLPPAALPDGSETTDINTRSLLAIEKSLDCFSNIDMLYSRKYDTSAHLDRSQTTFPNDYITALAGRSIQVPRGIGYLEAVEDGKLQGRKQRFQSVTRPRSLNLAVNTRDMRLKVRKLRDEYAMALGLLGGCELVTVLMDCGDISTNMIPYLRQLLSMRSNDAYQPLLDRLPVLWRILRGQRETNYSGSLAITRATQAMHWVDHNDVTQELPEESHDLIALSDVPNMIAGSVSTDPSISSKDINTRAQVFIAEDIQEFDD